MKHEPKKHFDVSKPRRHGADPTSKPVIVGHHPMMPDPMIRETRDKAPKPITVFSDGEELPHPVVTKAEKPEEEPPKPDTKPELSTVAAPNPASPTVTPSLPQEHPQTTPILEHKPGAVFAPANSSPDTASSPVTEKPTAQTTPAVAHQPHQAAKAPTPPTPTEPPVGQELRIPAGHGIVRHKPKVWVWIVVAIIILLWIYAAVDALTDTNLPYEFFTNPASQTESL
jgi:hypothetical protein